MLQEFGVTCACGAVYTQHWRQLLQEFGAACVCGTVYTRHWKNICSSGYPAEAVFISSLHSVAR